MSQQIEFFLHPPSPIRSASLSSPHSHAVTLVGHHGCTLPPVSSLLQYNQLLHSQDDPTDLPILCLPSPSLSSYSSLLEPVEPYSSTLDDNTSSPSLSPFMSSLSLDSPPQLSPQTSPYPTYRLLLPPPTNTRRCRSLSNASTNSHSPIMNNNRRLSDPPLYFDLTSTTEPCIAKRKRGRPPNTSRSKSNQQRDSWTFVTPTVCDVKQTKESDPCQQQQNEHATHDDFMVLHWPSSSAGVVGDGFKDEIEQQHTFTNTSMDTALGMPKKKRGRKPKMQPAGNFCFVWRDLTARRGANKKKPMSSAKS